MRFDQAITPCACIRFPSAGPNQGRSVLRMVEATTGLEPVYAVLQTAPWPLGHVAMLISRWLPREDSNLGSRIQSPLSCQLDDGASPPPTEASRSPQRGQKIGAEDGTRTRDPHLGKVMLYQLSHFRPNRRRAPREMVPRVRIELTTPASSGRCSTN